MVYCLKHQVNISGICIVFFTCNVYIYFLLCVGFSTYSVWFLMSIYRTQLFKNCFDSIQVIMMFFIRLVKLDYLLVNNFNLSLQRMTTCKIRYPNFFKCSDKQIKRLVLHVWPNNIRSHNIMISPFHPYTLSPFWIHFNISSSHNFTIAQVHHWIYIIFSKLALIPCSFFCVVPWSTLPIISKYLKQYKTFAA